MKIKFDKPPTKTPFIIWTCRDGLYRIVCARIASGTAEFVIETNDGSDAMGQPRWTMISPAPHDNPVMTSICYDFLEAVCPNWRALNA
jgi:hypothetical protein